MVVCTVLSALICSLFSVLSSAVLFYIRPVVSWYGLFGLSCVCCLLAWLQCSAAGYDKIEKRYSRLWLKTPIFGIERLSRARPCFLWPVPVQCPRVCVMLYCFCCQLVMSRLRLFDSSRLPGTFPPWSWDTKPLLRNYRRRFYFCLLCLPCLLGGRKIPSEVQPLLQKTRRQCFRKANDSLIGPNSPACLPRQLIDQTFLPLFLLPPSSCLCLYSLI